MLEEHGLATLGTQEFGLDLCLVRLWLGFGRGGELAKVLAHGCKASPACGCEEAIVTDLHEVFGQDMLQETMDEVLRTQGTTFFCTGFGVTIAKRNSVTFQLEEAVVAQGDPENVRGQILQRIQARAHAFTVDDPILLPNLRGNKSITIGAAQSLLQFATENSGERSHGQQEVLACRSPAFFCVLPASTRNEIVDVRMVGQVATPGVQHTQHPELAANPAWLLCQLLGCCGRGFEEQIIEQALVRASDFIKARGQGEGEQEVGDGQEQILLSFQPGLGILILAFGTMAVAAGMVTVLQLLTIRTAIDLPAQGFSATLFNCPHHFEVCGRHPSGVLLAIGRAILAKDICQF